MENRRPFKYTDDIKGYQSAVWDFLLEHSDITPTGKIFIKFHTDGQKNFENRVLARWKYNYHREDVQSKAEIVIERQQGSKKTRKEKKAAYRQAKKDRLGKIEIKGEGTVVTINEKNIFSMVKRLQKIFTPKK